MESERALKGSFYTINSDFYKWIGTFTALIMIWVTAQSYSLDYKTSMFFMITIFAVLLWCFSLILDAITGLLLPTLYVVFKVASPNIAFKPWTSTITWLVLTMLNETGVARRITIWSIAKFWKTFATILLGITLAGIIITPFIPSVIAKIVIFNIITMGLIKTLGYKPKSLEATLLTMAGFFVISTFRLRFATEDSGIIIGLNYVQQATGQTLTWMQYLIYNLPYIFFILLALTVSYISGILLNFLLTPLATMSSFTIPLIQLGLENNTNPYVMIYIFQVSLDQYLLPYEFAGLLLVYTSGYVSLSTLVKTLIVRMFLGLVILLGIAYPWWNILGIISI